MSEAEAASPARAQLEVIVDTSPLRDGRRQAGIGRYVSAMVGGLKKRDDVRLRVVGPLTPTPHDSWVARWLNAQPALALARVFGGDALLHGMASEASIAWPPARQVVTIHDVIPWTVHPTNPVTRHHLAAQAERLRGCAAVIAVSQTVATEAIDRLGLDGGRVHEVPEGVSDSFSPKARDGDDQARHRAGIPDGDYLLWVGSLRHHDPRKALDLLLEAIAYLPPITMVLAGAAGHESRRVAARAEALGVRAVLPGYVSDDDLAALYRGAAVTALPSMHEGFGLPMLEAMASGAPVVATRAGNLADLAGDAAVLVPREDPAAFGSAIARLLRDRAERARLAQAGPELAAGYTWQRAVDMTIAIYRTVRHDRDAAQGEAG